MCICVCGKEKGVREKKEKEREIYIYIYKEKEKKIKRYSWIREGPSSRGLPTTRGAVVNKVTKFHSSIKLFTTMKKKMKSNLNERGL